MLLPSGIVSPLSANTKAFGIVAPRRLSMIGCGIATTSALIVRVHCCIAGAAAVVAVVGVIAVVVAGVSGFTDSVSAMGDSVASLAVVSETGAASREAGLVAGAGFGSEALSSATGLFAGVAGVCPLAITAVSKLKAITVNEARIDTGDLKPSICVSPLGLL